MNYNRRLSILAIGLSVIGWEASAQRDTLLDGFQSPPNSARPRVWWHWMNGNITKDGIRKDLIWMKRIGIGGFQNFDAGLATPQVVPKRLLYMTPEWKDALRYATNLADSLGLEMAIAGSPGWSESGGPWVLPKDGMKKYVWSETRVQGGKQVKTKLAHPPTNTGTFLQSDDAAHTNMGGVETAAPVYYGDISVIAYKSTAGAVIPEPVIRSSGGTFNISQLTDGDIARSAPLAPTAIGDYAWIAFDYGKPVRFRSLVISGGGVKPQFSSGPQIETRFLEVSDDGKAYRKVCDLPLTRVAQATISFDETTGRFWRVNILTEKPKVNAVQALMGLPQPGPDPKPTDIAEIRLGNGSVINKFEDKAGFGIDKTIRDLFSHPTAPDAAVISATDIIDISAKMDKDGNLDWAAPAGDWNVIRFGYSLTGRTNHPASPEATGLEVDKLDPVAVSAYINNYLDQYKAASGGLMGRKGLQYLVTDSWEAGTQNWTTKLPEEFRKRRGYSITPWMPVLAGHIVGNAAQTDKFLFDFRETLGEMVKEYHYDVWAKELKKRGMGLYAESHESGRAYIGDGMSVKSNADIPMSAMWTPGGPIGGPENEGPAVRYQADVRESSSVSHLYGKRFTAAESMTAFGSSYAFSPERLKPTADMEMACGLNRFVIHCSPHQPVDEKFPGLSLGPFGQWFTRHETWAEQAKSWMDYLSRSCFMLQQGQPVADVLYYYGEDNNITTLFRNRLPEMPNGYSYDFVNTDALMKLVSASDGRITTPSGMRYSALVLDSNCRMMSAKVLRKIEALSKAGVRIVGAKPQGSPALNDDATAFNTMADAIWANTTTVYPKSSLGKALSDAGTSPDCAISGAPDGRVVFVHRKIGDGDIYWIHNRDSVRREVVAKFRVNGAYAEYWIPETGETKELYTSDQGNSTTLNLRLDARESGFVVFQPGKAPLRISPMTIPSTYTYPLDGSWTVTFQQGRGAPADAANMALGSWTRSTTPGVRYFSGTASYKTSLELKDDRFRKGGSLLLDLGEVKNIAEVYVNGTPQGTAWHAPFKLRINPGTLHVGRNEIEIRVTNLWVNRLIGDAQPSAARKIGYTTIPFYDKNGELLPSGLIGPVKLVQANL